MIGASIAFGPWIGFSAGVEHVYTHHVFFLKFGFGVLGLFRVTSVPSDPLEIKV